MRGNRERRGIHREREDGGGPREMRMASGGRDKLVE
jgi:hypothetical protein